MIILAMLMTRNDSFFISSPGTAFLFPDGFAESVNLDGSGVQEKNGPLIKETRYNEEAQYQSPFFVTYSYGGRAK